MVDAALTNDPNSSDRRSRLLGVKLAALVREHAGAEPSVSASWPGAAALVADGDAWVLADERPAQALGPALAWARRQNAAAVHVLAEQDSGVLARRAALFALSVSIWHVEGRALLPALASPYPDQAEVPAEHERFVELIEAAGAVVNREHGVLTGEVAGLEVCRAVTEAATGVPRLEVGVGAHDREAFLLMHGEIPTQASLERIVDAVKAVRRAGADPHPLNRLAKERLLRAHLVEEPALIGAVRVTPTDPPIERVNVKDAVPCVAVAERPDGTEFVVVCSTGVDLDLVPFAADARGHSTDAGELVLVLPSRDAVGVTRELAAALLAPATVFAIDWNV